MFFTALSKHALGAGPPKKKQWQRTKQAMTQHTHTSTRKVTIRFHLFDQKKRLFQNKNKAARGTASETERERLQNLGQLTHSASLPETSLKSGNTAVARTKRCLNLIASNVNKNKATRCYPFPRQPNTHTHRQTYTDTRKEIVKPGSSNFYKLHIFYK